MDFFAENASSLAAFLAVALIAAALLVRAVRLRRSGRCGTHKKDR